MFQDNDDIAHRTTGQSDEGGEVKWLFSRHTITRRHTLDMFEVLLDLCLPHGTTTFWHLHQAVI
jgi:hypothetical protein